MAALTAKQLQVLNFVEDHVRANGYAPTLEEIAKHMHFASVSNAHQHVRALITRGYLRRDPNRSRALEVVRSAVETRELPFLGYIAAGAPVEVAEHRETFDLGTEVLRDGDYVLRVRDDSLWSEQIRNGDYLIVKSIASASLGDLALAMRAGVGSIVGRMVAGADGHLRLRPCGGGEEVEAGSEELSIRGIVSAVARVL